MHFLVLGSTGQAGLDFVQQALQSGHRLTLYVRSPSKLPEDVIKNINVVVVEGDFKNMEAIKNALSKGAETLVSLVGPAIPHKRTDITTFYNELIRILPTESTIKRCMILSTASYHVSEDSFSLKWWFGVLAVKLLLGSAYQEINGMSAAIASLPPDKVEWTLFRVPGLTNGEAKAVRAGYVGGGIGDGLLLSRKSIGVWILQELQERRWLQKAPALCNPGWI